MDFMDVALGAVVIAGLWFACSKNADGMTRWQQFLLGKTLADLTTFHEAVDRVGGNPDLLGANEAAAAERVIEVGERRMRNSGPVVVTRELLKNMRLASALGRTERAVTQNALLNRLVQRGLAVDPAMLR